MSPVNRKVFILQILLVLVLACTAAYFSNQPMEKQDMRAWLRQQEGLMKAVRALPPVRFEYGVVKVDSQDSPEGLVQFVLRKLAHITLYGLLGVLIFGIFRTTGRGKAESFWLALLLLAVGASADELHQRMVQGRAGQWLDVVLDLVGFLLFYGAARLCTRRWQGPAPDEFDEEAWKRLIEGEGGS